MDIGGVEVKVLSDRAICYVIGETPYCIPLSGIKNQSENRVVTDFCKKMLDDGRLEYYEYSCEYLSKYFDAVYRAVCIKELHGKRAAIKSRNQYRLYCKSCAGFFVIFVC